jgi:hypothetical protein
MEISWVECSVEMLDLLTGKEMVEKMELLMVARWAVGKAVC